MHLTVHYFTDTAPQLSYKENPRKGRGRTGPRGSLYSWSCEDRKSSKRPCWLPATFVVTRWANLDVPSARQVAPRDLVGPGSATLGGSARIPRDSTSSRLHWFQAQLASRLQAQLGSLQLLNSTHPPASQRALLSPPSFALPFPARGGKFQQSSAWLSCCCPQGEGSQWAFSTQNQRPPSLHL